jgi:hypothetical protein
VKVEVRPTVAVLVACRTRSVVWLYVCECGGDEQSKLPSNGIRLFTERSREVIHI